MQMAQQIETKAITIKTQPNGKINNKGTRSVFVI